MEPVDKIIKNDLESKARKAFTNSVGYSLIGIRFTGIGYEVSDDNLAAFGIFYGLGLVFAVSSAFNLYKISRLESQIRGLRE